MQKKDVKETVQKQEPAQAKQEGGGFARYDFNALAGEDAAVQFIHPLILFTHDGQRFGMMSAGPGQSIAVPFVTGKIEAWDAESGVLEISHTPDGMSRIKVRAHASNILYVTTSSKLVVPMISIERMPPPAIAS